MGKRRDRFDQRAEDQATARSKNAPIKVKERARRDARMRAILKAGQTPYPRVLRTWMCAKLRKKEHQITKADLERLLKTT